MLKQILGVDSAGLDANLLTEYTHALKQPLQSLQLLLGSLSPLQETAEAKLLLAQTQQAATQTSDLLNALLDLLHLTAQQVQAQPEVFDIRPLRRYLQAHFAQGLHPARIVFESLSHPPLCYSDPLLLERLLINLLELAVQSHPEQPISLREQQQDDTVQFIVAPLALTTPTGVQTLLLQTAQQLAKLLTHSLELKPEAAGCWQWVLQIPQAHTSAPVAHPVAPLSMPSVPSILLIDDELANRILISKLLESWGYTVQLAENAAQALASVQTWTPTVILTDYRLAHGVTGIQVIEQISAVLGRTLPAIVLTGDSRLTLQQQLHQQQYQVLLKPIKPAQLRSVLNYLLRQRSTPAAV